jgi:hypothetical protein
VISSKVNLLITVVASREYICFRVGRYSPRARPDARSDQANPQNRTLNISCKVDLPHQRHAINETFEREPSWLEGMPELPHHWHHSSC